MPVRIDDLQLADAVDALSKRQGSSPSDSGELSLLELLAAVGDGKGYSAEHIKRKLRKALSKGKQLSIVRAGLSVEERADLSRILDSSDLRLSGGVRNFLEAVIGRAKLDRSAPVVFELDSDGLHGLASPYAEVELRNLSTSVAAGTSRTDSFESWADGHGRFDVTLPGLKEGDLYQVRTVDAGGDASDWITLQAKGLSARDKRSASLALFRLELTSVGHGRLRLESRTGRRPISEPHARVRIRNARTGESLVVELDRRGRLSAPVDLAGRKSDRFQIAVSDGRTNRTFRKLSGEIGVDSSGRSPTAKLPDPAPDKPDLDPVTGASKFESVKLQGKLFGARVSSKDVVQGYLANCYMPAAVGAVAERMPGVIRKMIRENDDGTYTVTFKEWSDEAQEFSNIYVTVDRDVLWDRSGGTPRYGWLGVGDEPVTWWPIMEKAFAAWKGSYAKIGDGGYATDVFEACTGAWGKVIDFKKPDEIWKAIKESCDRKLPATLATHGKRLERRFNKTGLYADHTYTLLACKESRGKRMVKLRNPWGNGEPKGNGPDDGIFWLPLEKVCELCSHLSTIESA